jgi:hypothetical protein
MVWQGRGSVTFAGEAEAEKCDESDGGKCERVTDAGEAVRESIASPFFGSTLSYTDGFAGTGEKGEVTDVAGVAGLECVEFSSRSVSIGHYAIWEVVINAETVGASRNEKRKGIGNLGDVVVGDLCSGDRRVAVYSGLSGYDWCGFLGI